MSYRPYPNPDRALRQVRRGGGSSSVEGVPAVMLVPRGVSRAEVMEAFPVGRRVMSVQRASG
ncbi:hypothetical protein H4687_005805 [Streptomyces stelliscabiei]|uniref:Uncharacterized protein n=1 Tax=Streptomyces stelliscabiei TaxID=146820 RepID=A0A8I0TU53_9ACTN|nr:hypothetical protein [Streptomyces stelliscabiei]